jgi:hypothetical protein
MVTASADPFTVTACRGGFAPGFTAGTTDSTGGAFSPFTFQLKRSDGEQELSGVTATLPAGVLAAVRDVPLCSDADAAAGNCPAASRVGTATVGSGSGSTPFFLQGPVSLTGPYGDAPYGLAIAIRAIAGPYDLGTVVVRQKVYVDPTDAHLTVVSDPLPTILAGVPLRLRAISVDLNRPGFLVNPTSCSAKTISTTVTSLQGTSFSTSSHFQATGCGRLRFSPRLALQLNDRTQNHAGGHPGLEAVLTQSPGEANLREVAVTLPLTLALDPENAEALCSFADGLRSACPASSVVGRATAVSPLLKAPLRGNVYLVQGLRANGKGQLVRTLPTLLVALRGEIALDLRATSAVQGDRLVSRFSSIPDAALTAFHMTLSGGRHGILVVTNDEDVCKGRQVADLDATAQNVAVIDREVLMDRQCPKLPAVTAAKVTHQGVRVTVRVPGAGQLTLRGSEARLATERRSVAKAGRYTVTLKPTASARRGLKRHRRLRVRIGVRFTPAGGNARTGRTCARTVALMR